MRNSEFNELMAILLASISSRFVHAVEVGAPAMTRDTAERARELAWEAAGKQIDWMQILLNLMNGQETGRDGQPCFFIGGGHFCGRAKFWDGHIVTTDGSLAHRFVPLLELLTSVQAKARLEEAKWFEYRLSILYELTAKDSIEAMETLRADTIKRIAALAQALQPEEKEK